MTFDEEMQNKKQCELCLKMEGYRCPYTVEILKKYGKYRTKEADRIIRIKEWVNELTYQELEELAKYIDYRMELVKEAYDNLDEHEFNHWIDNFTKR